MKKIPLTKFKDSSGQDRYTKMIRGKRHYFGSRGCTEREAVLDYLSRKDKLEACTFAPLAGSEDLETAVNFVLNEKREAFESGEISFKHNRDLLSMGAYILATLPRTLPVKALSPEHYAKLRSGLGDVSVVTKKNRLAKMQTIFRRIVKLKFMPSVDDADALLKPSAKAMRLAKEIPLLITPEQARTLVASACPQVSAMILLGLNCAYINCDVARLTVRGAEEAIKGGWLVDKREKTGIDRIAYLWPETKAALQVVLDTHKGTSKFLFVTKYGGSWNCDNDSALSKAFKKLTTKVGVSLTFARLRHHFQTLAEEQTMDPVAVKSVMGHADHSISAVYRDRVLRERVARACEVVRKWYLTKTKKPATPKEPLAKVKQEK
jgi:integrase